MSKQSFTQIPNSVVRNNKINPIEFTMLLHFKHLYYLSGSKEEYIVDPKRLKGKLNISDNRTIKKYLFNLYEQQYLKEPVEIKNKNPLCIKLNIEKYNEKPFTQLPADLIKKIEQIEYIGIRLLYYYESYINRSDIKRQFCFPKLETIENDLGIVENTITKYNTILVKNKLLKIEKHKLGTEHTYTDNDELIYDRYNNHYYVRIENM